MQSASKLRQACKSASKLMQINKKDKKRLQIKDMHSTSKLRSINGMRLQIMLHK